MTKLNDDELMNVAGGFVEKADVPTKGMEIKCPGCGRGDRINPQAKYDPGMNSVEYSCSCGVSFVCYENSVILKPEWINICKSKKYRYPFQ